jgi:hypothetical protein
MYVHPTKLARGVTAYRLPNEPEFGGPILWWDQKGTYIALSGPKLTFRGLIRIAGSMSDTAVPRA